MGFGWQELLIILVIVALIFGTKKLRNIGSDLGGAVKGFKDSVSNEDAEKGTENKTADDQIKDNGGNLENGTNGTAEPNPASEKKDSAAE